MRHFIPQFPIVSSFVVFLPATYVLLMYQLMYMLKGAKTCHVTFCIRGQWKCFTGYFKPCIRHRCRLSSSVSRYFLDKSYHLDLPRYSFAHAGPAFTGAGDAVSRSLFCRWSLHLYDFA